MNVNTSISLIPEGQAQAASSDSGQEQSPKAQDGSSPSWITYVLQTSILTFLQKETIVNKHQTVSMGLQSEQYTGFHYFSSRTCPRM